MSARTRHTPTGRNKFRMSGSAFAATHRASVSAILGSRTPPVRSKGESFYNVDRWTLRFLVKYMCEWAKEHPGCVPTRADVKQWVHAANQEASPKREIVIAATPPNLTTHIALALIGGAYHEALHTDMSCRRNLYVDEIADFVIPLWAQVEDWSIFRGMLLQWSNIVEDIRIERRGCEKYPGIPEKMDHLQDFILEQEERGREVRAHTDEDGDGPSNTSDEDGDEKAKPADAASAMTVITATFRDIGLGYTTAKQKAKLAEYEANNPDAYNMVMDGPLSPMVDEAIDLPEADMLGSLRIAMEVIVQIEDLAKSAAKEQKEKQKGPGNGKDGEGKPACPQCGKDDGLVVRPKANPNGAGNVPGKGIVTCTHCGFQAEVDIIKGGVGKGQPGAGIKMEGFDSEAGEGKGQGKGQGDDEPMDMEDTEPSNDGRSTESAGGHHYQEGAAHGWAVVAQEIMADAAEGKTADVLDNNSALGEAVDEVKDREEAACKPNEAPYRPYSVDNDLVEMVQPSRRGKDDDNARAQALQDQMRNGIAFMRSRLMTLVMAVEQRRIAHGTIRGKGLSPRRLVPAVVSVKAGRAPTRPYWNKSDKIDTSLAACTVIDQSGSMGGLLQLATQIMMTIAEPLDGLGCPVLSIGFRDGPGSHYYDDDYSGENYHRAGGVVIDVFKNWEESFRSVRWRFANTRATGGTPMADGVQYGLEALSQRDEAHRVLFIITDGCPNWGHEPVIRRQIRLAQEAGIHVVGVGCGGGAQYVESLFPDSVYSPRVEEIPGLLIAKLNELMDWRGQGRGRRLGA